MTEHHICRAACRQLQLTQSLNSYLHPLYPLICSVDRFPPEFCSAEGVNRELPICHRDFDTLQTLDPFLAAAAALIVLLSCLTAEFGDSCTDAVCAHEVWKPS